MKTQLVEVNGGRQLEVVASPTAGQAGTPTMVFHNGTPARPRSNPH